MRPITRRTALTAASSVALLPPLRGFAQGSSPAYPDGPIRMLCAFPPGAGLDVLVRFFAEKLRPIDYKMRADDAG